MSLWVGSQEVGLSAGQTSGTVGGQQVYRDPSSDISKPYIQAESIQTTSGYPGDRILVEAGGQRFYTGRGEVPEIGSYRQATGFTSVRRTGMMSPAEVERQYQEQRGVQPVQLAPSPFQTGQVQYAPGRMFGTGYFTSPEYQKQYPSTPIDYSRTHVSELYSYPIYKGAAFISRGLQAGLERGIDVQPFPEQVKEVQKGIGSVVTGIPEFFASVLSGWEYAAREPELSKTLIVPGIKMFGGGLAQQATERPYYTLGQIGGMFALGKAGKTPKAEKIPTFEERWKATPTFEPRTFEKFQSEMSSGYRTSPLGAKQFYERYSSLGSGGGAFQTKAFVPGIGMKSIESAPIKIITPTQQPSRTGSMSIGEMKLTSEPMKIIDLPKTEFTTSRAGRLETQLVQKPKSIEKYEFITAIKSPYETRAGSLVSFAEPKIIGASLAESRLGKYAKKSYVFSGYEMEYYPIPKEATRPLISEKPLQYTRQYQPTLTGQKQISRQIPSFIQSSGQSSMSILTPIQISQTIQKQSQLTRQTQISRARSLYRSDFRYDFPITTRLKFPKTTSDIFGFGKKGRKVRRGSFKFPEMTRVATPKQIWKGFNL